MAQRIMLRSDVSGREGSAPGRFIFFELSKMGHRNRWAMTANQTRRMARIVTALDPKSFSHSNFS